LSQLKYIQLPQKLVVQQPGQLAAALPLHKLVVAAKTIQLPHMPLVYVAQVALLFASAMRALPSFCMMKRRGAVPLFAVLVDHSSVLALS
jgi:hypothetical protein